MGAGLEMNPGGPADFSGSGSKSGTGAGYSLGGGSSTAPTADQTQFPTDMQKLPADIKTAMTNTGGPTAAQLAQIQTDQDAVYAAGPGRAHAGHFGRGSHGRRG